MGHQFLHQLGEGLSQYSDDNCVSFTWKRDRVNVTAALVLSPSSLQVRRRELQFIKVLMSYCRCVLKDCKQHHHRRLIYSVLCSFSTELLYFHWTKCIKLKRNREVIHVKISQWIERKATGRTNCVKFPIKAGPFFSSHVQEDRSPSGPQSAVTRSYFPEDRLDGAKMIHSPPSKVKDKPVPSTRLTEWRLNTRKTAEMRMPYRWFAL